MYNDSLQISEAIKCSLSELSKAVKLEDENLDEIERGLAMIIEMDEANN